MKTGCSVALAALIASVLFAGASPEPGQWHRPLPADPEAPPEQIRLDVRAWIMLGDWVPVRTPSGPLVNPRGYGQRAIPALREVLETHHQHTPKELAGALGLLARVAKPEMELLELVPLIQPQLMADHVGVRASATRALGAVGGQQVTAALVSQLYDADPNVREAALVTLGRHGGPEALPALRIWQHRARAADATREYPWLMPFTEQRYQQALQRIEQRHHGP